MKNSDKNVRVQFYNAYLHVQVKCYMNAVNLIKQAAGIKCRCHVQINEQYGYTKQQERMHAVKKTIMPTLQCNKKKPNEVQYECKMKFFNRLYALDYEPNRILNAAKEL